MANFQTWQNWEWLIENIEIGVCSRPNGHWVMEHSVREREKNLFFKKNKKLIYIRMHPDECSSTKVREFISKGQPIAGLIPASVEKYILKNKLYINYERKNNKHIFSSCYN